MTSWFIGCALADYKGGTSRYAVPAVRQYGNMVKKLENRSNALDIEVYKKIADACIAMGYDRDAINEVHTYMTAKLIKHLESQVDMHQQFLTKARNFNG